MFHEYDVVKTTRPLSPSDSHVWPIDTSTSLPAGAEGTIVMIFTNDAPNYAYAVEFADKDGRTLALLILQEDDITLVQPYSEISSSSPE
jgi:hypothetical protein